MAVVNLSALTELTTLTGDEIFYVVDGFGGTPVPRYITKDNLATGLGGSGGVALNDEVALVSGTKQYVAAGGIPSALGASINIGADLVVYVPYWLPADRTLLGLHFEVIVAQASSNARVALYEMADTMQPGALVVTSGDIATATSGVKSLTTSTALAAGAYLVAIADSHAVEVRSSDSRYPNMPINTANFGAGSGIIRTNFRVSRAFAALADPGTAWTTSSDSSNPTAVPLIALEF